MAFSNYLENLILDFLLRDGEFTKPDTIAIGLVTTLADDAGNYTEVATSIGYERQTLSTADDWAALSNGTTSNETKLTFGPATDDWGNVKGFIITDSATHDAGNLLIHGALNNNRDVFTDDTFEVNLNHLEIVLN